MLCKLNHDVLRHMFCEKLIVLEVERKPIVGVASILNAFVGHIDGLTSEVVFEALREVQERNVTTLFVDGSNFGLAAKMIKKNFPKIRILTFFHNVESRFFWGALRQYKTFRALAILLANYLAERKSVKYSDKLICMSARDSSLVYRIYGRTATHISPIAIQDKPPIRVAERIESQGDRYALFVGGMFYANLAGIEWFVKNVVPRIDMKICIVGKGFESVKEELQVAGRVEVIGEVESLADWYRKSQFVIAPIFDGSGMKTKVAEALMYGKKIIGTPEAFSGYEDVADRAGWVCGTADDFVAAIARARNEISRSFDPELRALYEERYSYSAARSRLERILQ